MLDHAVEALQLSTFADRLERLAPCHRDPERFHIDKDALVSGARRGSTRCSAPSAGCWRRVRSGPKSASAW